MAEDFTTQRIARLTPLATVLSLIEARVGSVAPRKSPPAVALGAVLAEDVVARQLPPAAIALRDGYAVDAATLADAGPYAPVALPQAARRIDAGEPMPGGCDAVLTVDAVALRSGRLEAVAAVAPGEGVLQAGDDCSPRTPLRRAGERLRAIDIAVLAAAGITEVTVRAPRIAVVRGASVNASVINAVGDVLTRLAAAAGGIISDEIQTLDVALDVQQTDAIIAFGGTGSGRNDRAVQTLAKHGRVEIHGIAVSPGETAAFGFAGSRPVLLVPGRLDAALALWLTIGRHFVAKLAGGKIEDTAVTLPLKRKVSSAIGLTEVIPVICAGAMAEPLASGYLSFETLARSDGWIAVPADSEGYAAGTPVAVRQWP